MTEISLGTCRALVVNTVWRHTIVRPHPLELRLACSSMGLELHHCLRKCYIENHLSFQHSYIRILHWELYRKSIISKRQKYYNSTRT